MMRSSVLATVLGLAASLAAPSATAAGAAEDASEPDRITWSVAAADTAGPDGRRSIGHTVEPGASTTDQVSVTNHSTAEVTFAMAANDGYLTANGSFDVRPSGSEPVDAGSWIEVPPSVTAGPGETVVVPLDIAVPARATPGDHPAGVTASVITGDERVRVENRVGVRVDVRVPGAVEARLDATDLDVTYEPSWNPFAPGSASVRFDLVNDGNVRLAADPLVTADAWDGQRSTTAEGGEVLPGSSRAVEADVEQLWPLGPVRVRVAAQPSAVEPTGDAADVVAEPVAAEITAWALPVPQLLLLTGLVLLLGAGVARRRRRKQELDRLLASARAEGAAAAERRLPPAEE
ncbi:MULTISPECIES: WxL protein peptidoglycan domain-containing protein [unclassified Isoptericola]|uniref:WxL protein peptidoglycan domain-containing protein n=1 Tax=unclassified Isoptericola TaxID=2623355 RepID=UPI00271313D4|nr:MULTISPECIES: DUF916 domain-containing protein [unclassified Isoptericola]MDO8145629.1 hypothetical protein [Isoptericola sp. 178]MDO8149175.1 hypothetical protein [Isoptericola sp. b515]